MKILQKKLELCTQCRVCEMECSRTWFKEEKSEKSRIRIHQDNLLTCTQCGECIKICQVQAIYRDKFGVIKVDRKKCIGCFMCVGFCPERAMFMHNDYAEPFKCVACGKCVQKCPTNAIYILEEAAG
ncbi:MAG: 4Fe-4S binding protein [Spirochaetales bacterium]|nr:4Fe-4S binding protein [Spirochaetales bacterium]